MALRSWVVVGILSFAVQAVPPLPGQTTGTSSPGSADVKQNGKGKKTTTAPVVPLAEPFKAPDAKEDGGKVTAKDTEYRVKLSSGSTVAIADKNKTALDYIFDWGPWGFNGLLVAVGTVGIFVARRTLVAIERQADLMDKQAALMERQAALMEAPFDQWVDLINWKVVKQRATKIWVMVELVNPTDFPITLSEGYLNFARDGHPERPKTRYLLADKAFLSPKIPKIIELWLDLTLDEQAAGAASFLIAGEFSHFHRINRKLVTQKVEGRLYCAPLMANDPWTAFFTSETQMNPEVQEPDKPENRDPN